MEIEEIGGLMSHVFKIFIGNPDIIVTQITWLIFVTLTLTIFELNKETKI